LKTLGRDEAEGNEVLAHLDEDDKRGKRGLIIPMPGDVVEVIASDDCLIRAGQSYGIIEGQVGVCQSEYEITFNPSPLPWWDNGVVNSSGGPSRTIKVSALKYAGKTKDQEFHYFPHLPAAHSAKIEVHRVKVWTVQLLQCP